MSTQFELFIQNPREHFEEFALKGIEPQGHMIRFTSDFYHFILEHKKSPLKKMREKKIKPEKIKKELYKHFISSYQNKEEKDFDRRKSWNDPQEAKEIEEEKQRFIQEFQSFPIDKICDNIEQEYTNWYNSIK